MGPIRCEGAVAAPAPGAATAKGSGQVPFVAQFATVVWFDFFTEPPVRLL